MTEKDEFVQSIVTLESFQKRTAFDEISWSIDGSTKKRKAKAFIKAIVSGDKSFVEYIIKENEKANASEKFISDIIGREATEVALIKEQKEIFYTLVDYDFFKKYKGNSALYKNLSERKNKDILKSLLDRNIINIDACEEQMMTHAAWNKDVGTCIFLLGYGAEYVMAARRIQESRQASRSLEAAVKEFKENHNSNKDKAIQIESPKEVKLLEVTAPVSEQKSLASEQKEWEALNDNMVVQYETIKATGTKLQTVFNFMARDVTTICSINENPPAIVIRQFKNIENERALFEAWQKLKDLGKKPIEFKGNDDFIVHKPEEKQNIRIEGKNSHDR